MPRGPKGEKRPADAVGAAIKVAKHLTRRLTPAPHGRSIFDGAEDTCRADTPPPQMAGFVCPGPHKIGGHPLCRGSVK